MLLSLCSEIINFFLTFPRVCKLLTLRKYCFYYLKKRNLKKINNYKVSKLRFCFTCKIKLLVCHSFIDAIGRQDFVSEAKDLIMPNTAGNEFHIHTGSLAPPCSIVVRQRRLGVDRSPGTQFRNMEALELLRNLPNLGEGNGNSLQYPCLENLIDRGAWQCMGSQSWTRLSNFTFFLFLPFRETIS